MMHILFFGAVVQSPKGRSVSFANTNLEERIVQSVPKTSSKRITTKRKRPKPRAERGGNYLFFLFFFFFFFFFFSNTPSFVCYDLYLIFFIYFLLFFFLLII